MADTFTPEQIAQILEEFFKTVGTRQYIGARYVPIFGRKDEDSIEWDNTKPYEPLTIVLYLGNSYTSRQYVPAGVQITNEEFWAITGNYNAQIEEYRRETARALQAAQGAQNDINTLLPKSAFSAENTVNAAIESVKNDVDTLLPKSAFSADNTVKNYIDSSIESSIESKTYINPDTFEGSTDYEKLQACINYAQENRPCNILISRKYDITGHTLNINLPENEGIRTLLRINGGSHGEIVKSDAGYMFDSPDILSHGLTLENLHITSANKQCDVFNARNIIRITSILCYYYNCHNVFDGTDQNGRTVCQSHRSINNSYIRCHAAFESRATVTDCTFINDIMENHCDYGFIFGENPFRGFSIITLNIINCVIEGTDSGGIYFYDSSEYYIQPASVNIDGCYFEVNGEHSIHVAGHVNSMSIANCSFSNAGTEKGLYIDCAQFYDTKIRVENIFNSGYTAQNPLLNIVNSRTNRWIEYTGTPDQTHALIPTELVKNIWITPVVISDTYTQTSADGTFAPQFAQHWPSNYYDSNNISLLLTVFDSSDLNRYVVGIFTIKGNSTSMIKLAGNELDFGVKNVYGTFSIVGIGSATELTAYIKLLNPQQMTNIF